VNVGSKNEGVRSEYKTGDRNGEYSETEEG
jgi:hypothetical protein